MPLKSEHWPQWAQCQWTELWTNSPEITFPTSVGIALSGGMDSTVLLDWACRTLPETTRIYAYHVHHGLQTEADVWAEQCQQLCDSLKVPLRVHRLNPKLRQQGESVEAWARNARYAWLQSQAVECILLGHHQADQAETLLLQLLRGAGVAGLAAMPRLWKKSQIWWGRPFLNTSRAALLAYAQHYHLQWIEDPSNSDTRWQRNWLRHTVMPILLERQPEADQCLARSATHCAETWAFVQSIVDEDIAACSQHPDVLALAPLRTLPPFRCKQVLRAFFSRWTGLAPSTQHLQQALTVVLKCRDPERYQPHIQYAGVRFSWWHDQIWAHCPPAPSDKKAPSYTLPLQHGKDIPLPGGILHIEGKESILAPLVQSLVVSSRQGGEHLLIPRYATPQKLKHLWQEAAIPPWHRSHFPLIVDKSHKTLMWAPLYPHHDTTSKNAQACHYTGEGPLRIQYPEIHVSWTPFIAIPESCEGGLVSVIC